MASPSRRPSDEARLAALDAECASLRESNAALSAAVELRICQMIRDGRTTKEIAERRRVSPATVARQRERIRHKLGLTGSDANLGTYLRNFLVERS